MTKKGPAWEQRLYWAFLVWYVLWFILGLRLAIGAIVYLDNPALRKGIAFLVVAGCPWGIDLLRRWVLHLVIKRKKRPTWERGLYRAYIAWSVLWLFILMSVHCFASSSPGAAYILLSALCASPWIIHPVVKWIARGFGEKP